MQESFAALGDRIEIQSGTKEDVIYISRVEEVFDDFIRISVPIYATKLVLLRLEEKYKAYFHTQNGCFEAQITVKNRGKEGSLYYIDVTVGEGKKIQRRDFYRLECILQMRFVIDNGEEESEEVFSGIVKDISGGGIKFVSNTGISPGSTLKAFIEIKDEYLDIVLNVLHAAACENGSYKYEYGAKYKVISAANREKIIKYIFDEQRKIMLKKGNK